MLLDRSIAIIGMGCQFPGKSRSSESFWDFLCSGNDGVIPIPEDRWDWRKFTANEVPAEPGRTYLKEGGFLQQDIFRFDAAFFGISPREAETMDIQQRLLLEVTHQALEDAGISYSMNEPQNVGVFVGGFAMDNMVARNSNLSRDSLESTDAMGSSMTLLANRLSYSFNFRGPSFSIDTACSSSLVAVHQACESIRRGDCAVALAGGVNIMLSAEASIMMSRGGFLSPTCRCHCFDSGADGYVRAEGAGIVALKDYKQALADGDKIHAVIRASGINHDGKTAGLALPNAKAQEALMNSVCREAGIDPAQVDYVEAHGTGTKAGDLAEIESIHNAYNSDREKRMQPLVVGAVKSHFGHAEAAAGVAGLIKSVLVMKHGTVPSQLHFDQPNPDLRLSERGIVIPTKNSLSSDYSYKRAGVNSFGYGGTNAHVLIEAVEEVPDSASTLPCEDEEKLLRIVSLTAHNQSALAALANQSANFLDDQADEESILNWAYTHTLHRSCLSYGLSVPYSTREKMVEQLRHFGSREEIDAGMYKGPTNQKGKSVVFVCTGMGPQWWGMGQSLFEESERFRATAKRCDAIFTKLAGWSILDRMLADEEHSGMSKTEVAQPANVVLQIALAAMLEEAGIHPSAIVGHSVGEVAAAYLSGSLSLEDTICVAYHRSRLQQTLEGTGGMLAVGLSEESIQPYIDKWAQEGVAIAAVNSPGSVTLAGPKPLLEDLDEQFSNEQVFSRMLQVEIPYHSAFMEPIRGDLREALRELEPKESRLPFYSTVTGGILEGQHLQNGYWWNNVRKAVRFQEAYSALLSDGHDLFIELGPQPVLRRSMQETTEADGKNASFVSSLVRGEPELESLQRSLGQLWHEGVELPFARYFRGGQLISLPSYPFQPEYLWRETEPREQDHLGRDAHVFLQYDMPFNGQAWSVSLNQNYFPYLNEHRVQGSAVWPGAGYIEAALAINLERQGGRAVTLTEIAFKRMLQLNTSSSQQLISSFDAENQRWSVNSTDTSTSTQWKSHASGMLHEDLHISIPPQIDPGTLHQSMEVLKVEDYYNQLSDAGLQYGEAFQSLKALYRDSTTAVIELEVDEALLPESDHYQIHPAILDGAFQSFLLFAGSENNNTWIPVSIDAVHFIQPVGKRALAKVELSVVSETSCVGSIRLYNSEGETCLVIRGAVFRPLPSQEDRLLKSLFAYQLVALKMNPMPFDANVEKAWHLSVDGSEWAEDISQVIASQSEVSCSVQGVAEDSGEFPSDVAQWVHLFDGGAPENIAELTMQVIDSVEQAVLKKVPRLTLVTRGVYLFADRASGLNLTNSTVAGVLSVIANEWPEIEVRLIDLQEAGEKGQTRLFNELNSEIQENEICLSEQKRWQPVWSTVDTNFLEFPRTRRKFDPQKETACLVPAHDQSFEGLCHVPRAKSEPLAREVQIEVRSVGLNFKDILKATGRIAPMATEDTFSGGTLGLECSGIVRQVGSEVEGLKPGDRVSAFSRHGCFANRIISAPEYVTKIDDCISFEDASCVVPWITAHHSLVTQARLAAGEIVLIHSGAGGVGLAAIQVAHLTGARVIASASSIEKREYLSSLGVWAVVDSSSLLFTEEIRNLTNGRGVDVVLNALSGQTLQQSFRLLAGGGRFVEIGKRDILENRALPLSVFNQNISFISIDLDRILKEDPRALSTSVRFLWEGLQDGKLQALPSESFGSSQVNEAFKQMASRERIGRVSLRYDPEEPIYVEEVQQIEIKSDGSYLITGGTQGLGMAIAKEFAGKGAGQLVLVSRSGEISDADAASLRAINPSTDIICRSVDISDRVSLSALVEELREVDHPLRGVVHCALVLKDQMAKDMDIESLEAVLKPKVLGAHYLDSLLDNQALDFWVNFSSISTLIGNLGQAAYVVANTYLERLAQQRRLAGKPCLTILLGYVADVGVAFRNPNVARHLEKAGMRGMDSTVVASRLLDLCSTREPIVGFFEVNWQKWSQLQFETAHWGRFKELLADDPNRIASFQWIRFREKLSELEVEARVDWIAERIQQMFSEITLASKDKIDVASPMSSLGIDSLMVVELMGKLKSEFGISLRNEDLFQDLSIQNLSHLILKKFALDEN
ncbi:MAG: SDR family NAD(P)-dependent oxidoreductase [Coraliomargaritaceae bacterium]